MPEVADEDIPFFAEVTAGGRITIPEEIRKIFEIKDGDAVFCRLKIMHKKKNDTAKEAKRDYSAGAVDNRVRPSPSSEFHLQIQRPFRQSICRSWLPRSRGWACCTESLPRTTSQLPRYDHYVGLSLGVQSTVDHIFQQRHGTKDLFEPIR